MTHEIDRTRLAARIAEDQRLLAKLGGAEPRRRANYLLMSEVTLLRSWGRDVRRMFDEMPYLVGSSLERADYRDVDVRVMLDHLDDDIIAGPLYQGINLAVSLWGQKVTGLPIDFQVQCTETANAQFNGPRHPIGMEAR